MNGKRVTCQELPNMIESVKEIAETTHKPHKADKPHNTSHKSHTSHTSHISHTRNTSHTSHTSLTRWFRLLWAAVFWCLLPFAAICFPTWAQDGPKSLPSLPEWSQRVPKESQDGPLGSQKDLPGDSQGITWGPRGSQKSSLDASRGHSEQQVAILSLSLSIWDAKIDPKIVEKTTKNWLYFQALSPTVFWTNFCHWNLQKITKHRCKIGSENDENEKHWFLENRCFT